MTGAQVVLFCKGDEFVDDGVAGLEDEGVRAGGFVLEQLVVHGACRCIIKRE
jgi:hypothetical protein